MKLAFEFEGLRGCVMRIVLRLLACALLVVVGSSAQAQHHSDSTSSCALSAQDKAALQKPNDGSAHTSVKNLTASEMSSMCASRRLIHDLYSMSFEQMYAKHQLSDVPLDVDEWITSAEAKCLNDWSTYSLMRPAAGANTDVLPNGMKPTRRCSDTGQ